MRLSWFTSLRAGWRPKGKRHKLKSVSLRVRQLERRRVLDGAATTAVATIVTDVAQAAPTTSTPTQAPAQSNSNERAASTSTTVHATDTPPIVVPPLKVAASGNSFDASQFAASDLSSPGQGLAANTPPVLVPQVNQQVDEGQLLDLSGQNSHPSLAFYVDPDLTDTHTATVDWGDESPIENATITAGIGNGAIGGTHKYADNGTYTVTVSVADNNGGSASGSFDVLVKNVPPVLVTAPNQTVNEGQLLNLSGSGGAPPLGLFVDPGILDTHTATVDWGDGSPVENATVIEASGAGALGGTHTYADDGVYTVTVTVKDNDGGSDAKTFQVNVLDVAPTVDLNPVADINENGFVTLTGSYTDPGLRDSQTLKVNWGDPNNGTASTFAIGAIQNSSGTTTLDAGDTFNSSDGAVLTITSVDSATGKVGFSVAQHQYLDDGVAPGNGTTFDISTISVSVTDDENQTGSDTTTVAVHNLTPGVTLNPVSDINENGIATLSGSYTDIGLLDVHTLTINWGDPNNSTNSAFTVSAIQNATGTATLHVNDTFNSADGAVLTITSIDAATGKVGFTAQHQYLDDGLAPGNGTSSDMNTIAVTVADDDAQSGSSTGTVTVHNVAPTISLGPGPAITENATATIVGSFTDTGLLDRHTVTIDWDDPNNATDSSFVVSSIFDATGSQTLHVNDTFTSLDGAVLTITAVNTTTGQVGFSVQHQYSDDGASPGNGTAIDVSTIGVTVADDDGQSGSQTTAVTIHNVTPTVALNAVPDIDEHGTATLTGSFADAGLSDVHTVTVNWGDPNNSAASLFTLSATSALTTGQIFASSSGDGAVLMITAIDSTTGNVSFSVQHQYLDDGLALGNNTTSDVSTIGVTVADDDAQSGSSTTTVTVHNVAPVVALNAVTDINENGTATLTGSYTDIGLLDAHTVTINWGDPNNGATATFAVNAIQNAAGTATLHVNDAFSSSDGAVLTITSINTATGQVGFSVQHQYLDDGLAPGNGTASDASTIGVSVTDDDAQSGNNSTTVTVHNVTPSVALNSVMDVNENGIATLTGSYIDFGLLDAHTLTVSWGDPNNSATSTFAVNAIQNATGTAALHANDTFNSADGAVLTITAVDGTTGEVSFSVQHQYLDDGLAPGNSMISDVSTIGVTVADDDAQSGNDSTTVTVHNVTPSVALNSVTDTDENGTATLTGSYTDIGKLDGHTFTVNWGDPNNSANSTFTVSAIQNATGAATLHVNDTFNSSDGAVLTITSIDPTSGKVSFSVQHQYLDDGPAPGNNTISDVSTIGVTVADDDAQSGSNAATVTVNNVAPTVSLNPVADIDENGTATLTGSYTDIGKLDGHTITVDWNDPNNTTNSTFTIKALQNPAGAATLDVNDAFSSADGAILTITAIDTTTGKVDFSVQHQYLDDGLALGNNTISDVSIIGVTVADDDAQSGTDTTTVTVHNVAPSVALNAVADIDENGLATLTGSYTDIGLLDAHTVTVTWDDPNNGAASTFAIEAIQNAAGTATLHVNDTFGSADGAVLTITAIDPTTGKVSFSVQHQYLDDGPAPGNGTISDVSTIGVTATDDDTQEGSSTTTIVVHNVAPQFTDVSAPSIDEGHVATISFVVDDPSTLDVFSVTVDWRDGTTATIGGLGSANSSGDDGATHFEWDGTTRLLTLTHLYPDNAIYPVEIRMADDDMAASFGGTEGPANFVLKVVPVTVNNVAPMLGLPAVIAADEGAPVTLNGLGIKLTDFGFDNSNNQTAPPLGDQFQETFAASFIKWGDDSTDTFQTTPVDIINRESGSPNVLTTADFMHASHVYADNGTYTVTVRVADDNMGAFNDHTLFETGVAGQDYVDLTFTITINNVAPSVTVPNVIHVNEGTAFSLSSAINSPFRVLVQDPGFDNLHNPNSQPGGSQETLVGTTIDWGDGTAPGTINIDNSQRAIGSPGVLTSVPVTSSDHTYADDGTYTVTVTIRDDDMATFVQRTFTITVDNVAPDFVAPPGPGTDQFQGTDLTSGGQTFIHVDFTDPGFDNTNNPNAPAANISDPKHETFTHVMDWGEGIVDAVHTYAESGEHTVTITRTLLDGSGAVSSGPLSGFDSFKVLTLVSSQDVTAPDSSAQDYRFTVDWGDGVVQTIVLTLKNPGAPGLPQPVQNQPYLQTVVSSSLRESGIAGTPTSGGFDANHTYFTPPDPLSPTDPIPIRVFIVDDNNGSVDATITVQNPGINTFNVAIDTTPDVPHLDIVQPQFVPVLLNQTSAAPSSLQPQVTRIAHNELAVTSDRYLELVVIAPDGTETERYRLSDEALVDLRGLFATLPDGRYKIFLKRTDTGSSRLVMDVFVRRGRIVDPSDDSEGTRDRPPSAEEAHQNNAPQNNAPQNNAPQNNAPQNNGPQNNAPQIGAPPKQLVPLKNNPLLKPVPTGNTGATNERDFPAAGPESALQPSERELSDLQQSRFRSSMRWALPLAGLGLMASRESWSERLGAALEAADEQAWQRLRRAGRLGRSGGKISDKSDSKMADKSRSEREKLAPTANTLS